MTKSIPNHSPNPNPKKPNWIAQLLEKLTASPQKVAIGVAAIAAGGAVGYWGIDYLVKNKLPPLLESQISKIIERPLDLGEVKGFSLGSIEFGETSIPATATDSDRVTVEGVKVGFNIFPVIFRRTLPLDISLIQPDIYVEQEQNGQWLNLDFLKSDGEKKEPLIYFNVDLDVEQADITAVPYNQSPIEVQVDGSGSYNQTGEQLVTYDFDATIERAKATIKGETRLATGQSDSKLLIKDLALDDVTTLLSNSPVNLNSGVLNADLDINLPSFREFTQANIRGKVSLDNVAGEVTDLSAPVTAKSELNLTGRKAEVNQTQASLGNIVAQVDGTVGFDSGYNLNINILPFQLGDLPPAIRQKIPVDLAGKVASELKLRGDIREPLLTGKVNNLEPITVNKTDFKQVQANFQADLTTAKLENLNLMPEAGGEVTATGTIVTNLKQALEKNQPIDVTEMPLVFNFQAQLPTEELVNPYYQLPQQYQIGNLNATGKINGTINNSEGVVNWQIPAADMAGVENISGAGKLLLAGEQIRLEDTEIKVGQGIAEINGQANLNNQQWQANLTANSWQLTPWLTQFNTEQLNLNQPLTLETADVKLKGKLDNLALDKIQADADLNLDVNGGDVAVDSQLNRGNFQAQATTNNVPLSPFVNNLAVPTTLTAGKINTSGKIAPLLKLGKNPNLDTLKADADLNLDVDGNKIEVDSQIDSGVIEGKVNTEEINLERVVANLPVPATIQASETNFSAQLSQLLTFSDNPNLSSVNADVNADLTVAEGTVKAIASLNNNQWQANIDAADISSALLLETFASENLASLEVDNINAQADLNGSINPVINNEANIPINVNRVAVATGEQSLNAQGDLTLSNITSNLDVANTNLDVNAKLNFEQLPIKQLLAITSNNNQLLVDSADITGRTEFNGQLQGKQLISAPTKPGNLALTGDLRLLDFAFNDVEFDPVMRGNLKVEPVSEIALNLQGEQDVIAATAVPCNAQNCRLPYLPTKVELRQGEDTPQPVIATGDRLGDIFSLDINNFPLALLNLAPGKAAGIQGALTGKTTGEIDVDLYTFATQGEVAIAQPGVGYIKADELTANFNYDPDNNIAEVTTASLDLGRSRYDVNAALDLESGAIAGKLDIPQAYIQDLLTTFRWFTIEDLSDLFNTPDYAAVAEIKPPPEKDLEDKSIARKLNQLRLVENKLQEIAAERDTGSIPTQLNLDGKYTGAIAFGGTLEKPETSFNISGKNWQWQPQPEFVTIVPPLGVVKEASQYISISELLIKGNSQGTVANLETAKLQLEDTVLSVSGQLSPQQEDIDFQVANLTIDTISKFVKIPVDVAGKINATGTLTGSPQQPEIAGELSFSNGAFNGNALPTNLAGNFDYNGERLQFDTSAPEAIQVDATIPYPIIPGKSDRLSADVKLEKEAFVLLNPLTQGYLTWIGGEGNAQLKADARLDLNRQEPLYDLNANGVVNLENARVNLETPFFGELFEGTGKITVNNQIVNVETLEGTFADKDLSINGKLPILTAVNQLENPLTIDLPPEGKIDIDKLYKGKVAGNVKITGAAVKPIIGGDVTLKDGQVFIPKAEEAKTEEVVKIAKTQATSVVTGTATTANSTTTASTSTSEFVTKLDNLQVKLDDFQLKQTPLYDFKLQGDLTLNGTVDRPENIKPKGTLQLTQADVNLLNSSFNLVRSHENTIAFTPEAGVFNPYLDIQLDTQVSEVQNIRLAESGENEISDPFSEAGETDLITVNLIIDGETQEILPGLGDETANCRIRPNNSPLVTNSKYYSESELNKLTDCFNETALIEKSDRQIINSPAVKLTSTPARTQGEIISLFGDRFLALAEQLQGGSRSQESLFDIGVNQFVIAPFQKRVLRTVDDVVVDAGKEIGLDYLRVLPNLEGIYEINDDSSVRSTYNYVLEEVRLEYQLRF